MYVMREAGKDHVENFQHYHYMVLKTAKCLLQSMIASVALRRNTTFMSNQLEDQF